MNTSSFLTVLKGKYKNRKIPIPKKIHGHNNVTPQKIKESIFQIIENQIDSYEDSIFIDLFAGSGQMGIEAASRGFVHNYFFDISRDRIAQIKQWSQQNISSVYQNCTFDVKDGTREFLKIIKGSSYVNEFINSHPSLKDVIVFADPPYGLNYKHKLLIDLLMVSFNQKQIENSTFLITLIIQTNKDDLIDSKHKDLKKYDDPNDEENFKNLYKYGRHRIIVIT